MSPLAARVNPSCTCHPQSHPRHHVSSLVPRVIPSHIPCTTCHPQHHMSSPTPLTPHPQHHVSAPTPPTPHPLPHPILHSNSAQPISLRRYPFLPLFLIPPTHYLPLHYSTTTPFPPALPPPILYSIKLHTIHLILSSLLSPPISFPYTTILSLAPFSLSLFLKVPTNHFLFL